MATHRPAYHYIVDYVRQIFCMPKHTIQLDISSIEFNDRKPILLGALQQLQWPLRYSGPHGLVAHTKRSAWKWEQEIVLQLQDDSLIITSATIHGEMMDLKKRNQKNIEAFQQALVQVQQQHSSEELEHWGQIIQQKEAQQASAEEQLNQVMVNKPSAPWVSWTLLAINVGVFILMVTKGVNIFEPTAQEILNWGGNEGTSTLTGEWWRLFTAIFVHIGIIHLAANMVALFIVGPLLENLIGSWRFLLVYLCTGVLASVASLWWQDVSIVSAGASGAIFGLFGVLGALITTRLLPKEIRNQLLTSVGVMIFYNLAYGLKSGANVDNAAHIGGLLSGIVFGYLLYFTLRPRQQEDQKKSIIPEAAILLLTAAITIGYLNVNKQEPIRDDTEAFQKKLEHFFILESMALEAIRASDTLARPQAINELRKTAVNNWADCVNLMDESEGMALSPVHRSMLQNLRQYANQRLMQTQWYIKSLEEDTKAYDSRIDSLAQEIDTTLDKARREIEALNNAAPGEK